MVPNFNLTNFCLYASTIAFLIMPLGCGEDPKYYRGERLTFESPVSAKASKSERENTADLDLSTDEASDFRVAPFGPFVIPWGPYPLYDYYLEPIPVEIPVSPFYSVIDFVHPMYFDFYLNPVDDDE